MEPVNAYDCIRPSLDAVRLNKDSLPTREQLAELGVTVEYAIPHRPAIWPLDAFPQPTSVPECEVHKVDRRTLKCRVCGMPESEIREQGGLIRSNCYVHEIDDRIRRCRVCGMSVREIMARDSHSSPQPYVQVNP